MAAKKRRPGRPPDDPRGAKIQRTQLRSLPEEREAWDAAAARRAISLSDWAREHLNRAAKREAQ
jgi:predicted HicB family RNase H-like nuclease